MHCEAIGTEKTKYHVDIRKSNSRQVLLEVDVAVKIVGLSQTPILVTNGCPVIRCQGHTRRNEIPDMLN